MGARVPIQTQSRAPPAKYGPNSPSRAKFSPVFATKIFNNLPVLGGVAQRTVMPNKQLMPNTPIAPQGTPAGLPYALGQMLLERAREDKEAYAKATKEERMYGASELRLAAPKKEEGAKQLEGPKADAEGGAVAAAGGAAGSKKSAKVAPM